jgi:hypothetical protein
MRESTRPLAVVHETRDVFINPDYPKSLKYRKLWRKTIQFLDCRGALPTGKGRASSISSSYNF